ncbi:MAG: aromatic ring-opening dioxygenase LigA [Actinomycetia bacterium]|nr:aromatic ring-opening dioxygenase LigA [Actinomycetes bacterium]
MARSVRLIGALSIVAGLLLVVSGGVFWGVITSQLAAEKVTVSADSSFLAGDDVNGPFSAYAQAETIRKHSLSASGGKTFAELGALATQAKNEGHPELADKYAQQRGIVQNGSLLRASLLTSVLGYGVCLLAITLGLVVGLLGLALTRLARGLPTVAPSPAAES